MADYRPIPADITSVASHAQRFICSTDKVQSTWFSNINYNSVHKSRNLSLIQKYVKRSIFGIFNTFPGLQKYKI